MDQLSPEIDALDIIIRNTSNKKQVRFNSPIVSSQKFWTPISSVASSPATPPPSSVSSQRISHHRINRGKQSPINIGEFDFENCDRSFDTNTHLNKAQGNLSMAIRRLKDATASNAGTKLSGIENADTEDSKIFESRNLLGSRFLGTILPSFASERRRNFSRSRLPTPFHATDEKCNLLCECPGSESPQLSSKNLACEEQYEEFSETLLEEPLRSTEYKLESPAHYHIPSYKEKDFQTSVRNITCFCCSPPQQTVLKNATGDPSQSSASLEWEKVSGKEGKTAAEIPPISVVQHPTNSRSCPRNCINIAALAAAAAISQQKNSRNSKSPPSTSSTYFNVIDSSIAVDDKGGKAKKKEEIRSTSIDSKEGDFSSQQQNQQANTSRLAALTLYHQREQWRQQQQRQENSKDFRFCFSENQEKVRKQQQREAFVFDIGHHAKGPVICETERKRKEFIADQQRSAQPAPIKLSPKKRLVLLQKIDRKEHSEKERQFSACSILKNRNLSRGSNADLKTKATAAEKLLLSSKSSPIPSTAQTLPFTDQQQKIYNKPEQTTATASASSAANTILLLSSLFPFKVSNSHTFPMSSNELEEFNEDFVPRSYAAREAMKSSDEDVTSDAKIRRMSLKEFSGLNDSLSECDSPPQTGSPLLHRLQNASGSLLEKFSSRRRSSTGLNRLSAWSNEHTSSIDASRRASETIPGSADGFHDSFDKAIESINLAIDEATRDGRQSPAANGGRNGYGGVEEKDTSPIDSLNQYQKLDFNDIFKRLNDLKTNLSEALKSVPNKSPNKLAQNIQSEKLTILSESRHLVTACKIMVRSASPSSAINEKDLACLISKVVESVERVTGCADVVIRKSCSLFQAQLFTAKLSEVLCTLTETIENLQKLFLHPSKQGTEAKQLIRTNTKLAANLTQLIQTVHRF